MRRFSFSRIKIIFAFALLTYLSLEVFILVGQLLVSAHINKYDNAVVGSWSLFTVASSLVFSAFLSRKFFVEPRLICEWILKFEFSPIIKSFAAGAITLFGSVILGFPLGDYLFCDNPHYMYMDFARTTLHSITPVIFEELLNRGLIFWALLFVVRNKWRFHVAIFVGAAIFSIGHNWHGGSQWSNYHALIRGADVFLFGVVLNLLILRTGSIWPGVAFHIASNMAIAILGGGTGIYMLLCRQEGPHILIHLFVFIAIATILYRQMDWKIVDKGFNVS